MKRLRGSLNRPSESRRDGIFIDRALPPINGLEDSFGHGFSIDISSIGDWLEAKGSSVDLDQRFWHTTQTVKSLLQLSIEMR